MLAVRLAWRAPCSVYPIAPVYSFALMMYASTSGSRFTSSRVTSRCFAARVSADSAIGMVRSCVIGDLGPGRPALAHGRRRGLLLAGADVGHRPPVRLHAEVRGDLQGQQVFVDVVDGGMQSADGDDPVALLQLAQHLP